MPPLRLLPRRYKVPRVAFINKLDRQGAAPLRIIKDLRTKLKLNAAAVQLPIGLEDKLEGVVDVVVVVGELVRQVDQLRLQRRTLPLDEALGHRAQLQRVLA